MPILPFNECHWPEGGPVGPPERSAAAKRKDCARLTPGGLPVQSFPDLLRSLSALSATELRVEGAEGVAVPALHAMTPLQRAAFDLLGLRPHPAPELRSPPGPAASAPGDGS